MFIRGPSSFQTLCISGCLYKGFTLFPFELLFIYGRGCFVAFDAEIVSSGCVVPELRPVSAIQSQFRLSVFLSYVLEARSAGALIGAVMVSLVAQMAIFRTGRFLGVRAIGEPLFQG